MSRTNLLLSAALFALSASLVWAYFRPSSPAAAAILMCALLAILAARRAT